MTLTLSFRARSARSLFAGLASAFVLAAVLRAAVDGPVSPNPLPEAKALLWFLDDIHGQYVLAGQQEFPGWSDESKDVDVDYVLRTTGKRPAVRGFDYLFYTHSAAGRAGQKTTERAITWARGGGIVTIAIHMFMDIGSPAGNPQFYVPGASGGAPGTTFDIRQAVIDGTPENRELLAKFDLLAEELKKLRDARVPVIWRPFHECSGGWFWWGAKGAEPFIKAWRLMFDRFTQVHGLNNLIWEYNPTDSTVSSTKWKDWYPGDQYVDMISFDYYPAAGTHPTFAADYQNLRSWKPAKIAAMSENGAIPDPDQLVADQAWWAYFCTWNGFQSNAAQNSVEFLTRVYSHANVVTLDELRGLWAARAFTLVSAPGPRLVAAGTPLNLSVTARDSGPLSYQWSRDGSPIAGATGSTYSVAAATAADAGEYAVAVTGTGGTLVSDAAAVTVADTDSGHIINLSVRALAGADDQALIPGFAVVGGSGPKPLVVRAVGPTMAAFGVANTVADPVLRLNTSPVVVNDDWEVNVTGTKAQLVAAFDQVYAFQLPDGSKDAALVQPLSNGTYTASISGKAASAGMALAEVYDTDPAAGARLVNISARANVTADAPIIAGFSIYGDARTVLVRAVGGATLTSFGVQGALPNPRLSLYQGQSLLATNDDWAGGTVAVSALQAAFDQTYAFQLDAATRDAVLLVTLPPGVYSAQVTSTDPGSGIALVEVYEVR